MLWQRGKLVNEQLTWGSNRRNKKKNEESRQPGAGLSSNYRNFEERGD
jgi:hypothetical protein